MASRLLARSKTLTLARFRYPGATTDPAAAAAASSSPQCLGSLHSLASRPLPDPKPAGGSAPQKPDLPASVVAAGLLHSSRGSLFRGLDSGKNCSSGAYLAQLPFAVGPTVSQTFLRHFSMKAGGSQADKSPASPLSSEKNKLVNPASTVAFSPLEGTLNKVRKSSLGLESFKVKQMELSIKLTYALIPALLLISKTKLTTSVLVMSVYWQVYGFFKEIILDYVHHEVTRKWVFIYFKLLLLILAKETLLDFNME